MARQQGKAKKGRMQTPRTPALAQIGKFSAMTYGFFNGLSRGPGVFFKSPKLRCTALDQEENFYD
jgi:hypothetical protein